MGCHLRRAGRDGTRWIHEHAGRMRLDHVQSSHSSPRQTDLKDKLAATADRGERYRRRVYRRRKQVYTSESYLPSPQESRPNCFMEMVVLDRILSGSPRIYAGEGALQRSRRRYGSDHALERWWFPTNGGRTEAPEISWKPPHLCGGRSASGLLKVYGSDMRLSAGGSRRPHRVLSLWPQISVKAQKFPPPATLSAHNRDLSIVTIPCTVRSVTASGKRCRISLRQKRHALINLVSRPRSTTCNLHPALAHLSRVFVARPQTKRVAP
jgi:hypothetical protein